jgi:hypothetical protein
LPQLGRFLEYNVRVRSSHAGGHDSGSSGAIACPFPQLRVDVKRSALEIDFGIGLAEVEAGRKGAMLEGQDGLYHAGDRRRRIEMPHVGFYRSDGAVT